MRAVVVWLVVLAACEKESNPVLRLVIDKDGAVVDHIQLAYSEQQLEMSAPAALTPALLARGDTQPPIADLWNVSDAHGVIGGNEAVAGPTDETLFAAEEFQYPMVIIGVGSRDNGSGELVPVVAGQLVVTYDDIPNDGTFTREIKLRAVEIEEWGLPRPKCLRYFDGVASTYLVTGSDRDCDGQFTDDCRPLDYCDPAATSGPLATNCTCP